MKFVENKTFPHPVLSDYSDDYVGRRFQVTDEFKVDPGTGISTLDIKAVVSDKAIQSLISKSEAQYVVEIYCPNTFLRRVIKSTDTEFRCDFKKGDLYGVVDINAHVVCCKRIPEFRSESFNPEFGKDAKFFLEVGDILAITSNRYWWDVRDIRPIGTVFELVESLEPKEGSFTISWDEDMIQIKLQKRDKTLFETMRGDKRKLPILMGSVYFPVLVETLRFMRKVEKGDEPQEYEEKRWFKAIEYKLEEKGFVLDKEKFVEHAQDLLGMPIGLIISESAEWI